MICVLTDSDTLPLWTAEYNVDAWQLKTRQESCPLVLDAI